MREWEYSWGARPLGDGSWRFRLWAPGQERLALRLGGDDLAMQPMPDGWFSGEARADEGDCYGFVLDDGSVVADPASRQQAADVHGLSRLVAPRRPAFWRGRPWEEAVIYELHLGTFTEAGTCRAAIAYLDDLADLGFTAIELMPVAHFGGQQGWGYDGVLPYAPHPAYGNPDDLRALVAAAHARGLMVLLDVVYNHFGPEGNYLHAYAPEFFDASRHTPWGAGIDYTRAPVRRFFIENAFYWLSEFGFDGLRLDAIDQIRDPSQPELPVELGEELPRALPDRPVYLTTEDNRNVTHLHEPRGKEPPLYRGEWNDDFHNAAHVAVTGESEGYYRPFAEGSWRLLGRALAEGFALQGENGRGHPSAHLPPASFVDFLQNHDQIGNRAFGERLGTLIAPEMLAALNAILLLSPHIPLLFMGDEYGETRPFLFFAGFEGDLGAAVTRGRRGEFADFSGFATSEVPDPIAPATFEASRLDRRRRDTPAGRAALARMRELLTLRARHVTPYLSGTDAGAGRLVTAENGVIAVDWRLNGANLALRASLSERAAPLPTAEGELFHQYGQEDAPPLVRHYLQVLK
ncbi:malto-oligosyltrehalose trehalohydrolase [Sulfitobacter aestuarii]|uniref:Malto-oligosyltrehalose trehalohydrolase n=1 Tax=Sulfitobacter aestuarii TaxID=2161676 RepID=A0ABW5TWJ5_9RHOB